MAKLSVVLISYNEVGYLSEAIESVINQSEKDLEILIVDDGSSDNSLEIIKKYQSMYPKIIKYFVRDRNDGVVIPSVRVSNSIKYAIENSSGKYFALLSGDDYFCDMQRFSNDIEFLERNKKYVATVSDFYKKYSTNQELYTNDYSRKTFWGGAYAHISCFTFRKEAINNILNYFCDDTGLIYSILLSGKVKWTHKVGFSYRQREKSITTNADEVKLAMLELLLFQDIINSKISKKCWSSSYSRFSVPIMKLKELDKEILNDKEYGNYFKLENEICKTEKPLIKMLINYDQLNPKDKKYINRIIKKVKVERFLYKVAYRLEKIFRRKRCK